MSTTSRPVEQAHDETLHRAVVVGVDGSRENRSAVEWAVAEALRTERQLRLLVASSPSSVHPVPFFAAHYDVSADHEYAVATAQTLEAELQREHPMLDMRVVVRPRDAVGLLLDGSTGAGLTVVGKRGLGAFARVMVGSTSIAVAGRNEIPTVVVPERWNLVPDAGRPIVVGLDLESQNDRTLDFAFERAGELGVRLIAVHGWQTHPSFTLGDDDRIRWGEDALRAMHTALRPWEEKYPDVDLEVRQMQDHPALVLLEKAAPAQLLVLGRHTAPDRFGGFALSSVDRAVLHYSTKPVAIVPE